MHDAKNALTTAECVALADEWAMLSHRSERRLWLVAAHHKWEVFHSGRRPRHKTLDDFLNQRHAISSGWNRAYRDNWVRKFNDFRTFALTERLLG